ncbi:MAG TPA: DUF2382 domain-containing protein [Chthoniobacterales bacterium]
MAATTHSIEVNAPLRAVYNQWTQFEEFPRFMEGIEEVRQDDDKRLFWRASVGGKLKEWEAEITNQVPDERIAWKSTDGSMNSGTVTFSPVSLDRTKVTATIEYEPEGFLEKTGDALGLPSGRVQSDLERFRSFIEERGRETGGWRGEISEDTTPHLGTGPSTSESGLGLDKEVEDTLYRKEAQFQQSAQEGPAGDPAAELPVSEEELKIGKRTVSAGEVRLQKKTSTQQVNVPVELKHEEAVIERIPAEEVTLGGKEPFQEEHIEVPLSREEPVVEKETHVTGGIRVRKTEGSEQKTIQESVRSEDVDVDKPDKSERNQPRSD